MGQDQIGGADGHPEPHRPMRASDVVMMPLAVDLDGTLLLTDTLFEAVAEHLRRRPLWAIWQLLQLPFAIAKVKDRLTKNVDLDVDSLPVNEEVLAYCKSAKEAGRQVWLVSAADQKMVDRIVARFDVFDRAIGSDGKTNNKGPAKAKLLEREAPGGFEYVGDSPADYKVWKSAARASFVDKGESRRRSIERMGVPVAHSFERPKAGWRSWLRTMHARQWARNALIFLPALLTMRIAEPDILLNLIVALPLLALMASGIYILNDLLNLREHRAHRSKSTPPLASGRIKLWQGFAAAPTLILVSLVGGAVLSPAFAATQICYVIVSLFNSLTIRRFAIAGTIAVSLLDTLRVVMGAVLAAVATPPWLLAFSMLLFISPSFARRAFRGTRQD